MPASPLPIALTSFVGRQREVAEITRLLAAARLVTITGIGGCGKTRLAQQLATNLAAQFADGISWVELGNVTSPSLVAAAVARAAAVTAAPGQPLTEQLVAHFAGRHCLLVLDNCEHVAAACAELAAQLLAAPRLTILATSRAPLGLPGEQRFPLPPLGLPAPLASLAEVQQSETVQLFSDRARAIVPSFAITAGNAEVIARICRQLDGLPLAIELASARVNVLALEQIEARLADRFALLQTEAATVAPRHQTLRAAIEWSYAALTPAAQVVLQHLALFVGGCDLAAVEAVCGGAGEPAGRLAELTALVDQSLVIVAMPASQPARYRLLGTLRAYAYAQLHASAIWAEAHQRFWRWAATQAEAMAPKLFGAEQAVGLGWFDREYDNLRQALAWAVAWRDPVAALRLANALSGFWLIRNQLEEGGLWLDRVLTQAAEAAPLAERVKALTTAAFVAGRRNEAHAAQAYAQTAVSLSEAAGEAGKPAMAEAVLALLLSAQATDDELAAYQLAEQALPLYSELGDPHRLSLVLRVGGVAATALGRYAEARALLTEGLALARAAGDAYRQALALNYLGDLARCEQDFAAAEPAYAESLALLRALPAPRDVAGGLHNLGHVYLRLDDLDRAEAHFRESLLAQAQLENQVGVAEGLVGFAALAVTRGLPGSSARLLAAAEAMRPPGAQRWPAERQAEAHYQALTRAVLDPTAYAAEAAQGRAMAGPPALAYALNLPLRLAGAARIALPGRLTGRENEIARLIVQGQSNGEIAAALVISKRTVEKHVANLLAKLGLQRREQIVRWGLENGLA